MDNKVNIENISQDVTLPKYVTWGVLAMCFLPFILNIVGINFGSESIALTVEKINKDGIVPDDLFYALKGASHHALLEWSAVTVAFFTIVLSFAYYRISKDITAPIIGIALFCSSTMDVFHTFAALRLIDANAPNTDLIPFTWALSRSFNAIILIVGALLVIKLKEVKTTLFPIISISLLFGAISYILIHLAATSSELPQTQYPDALITRPFDVLPLILFIIAIPIFKQLHRRQRSLMTAAMVLSIVPEIVLETHMAFGSSHLFDNNFNIAHFLKILAYFVPFIGLLFDYISSYQRQHNTQLLLEERERHLKEANAELEEFAYRTSHDLRSPIASSIGLLNLANGFIDKGSSDKAKASIEHVQKSLQGLDTLVQDILRLTEAKNKSEDIKKINLEDVINNTIEKFSYMDGFDNIEIQKNLNFDGDLVTAQSRLTAIVENLISNAIKYADPDEDKSYIKISTYEDDGRFVLGVEDNGLGIPKDQHNKIFGMFNRFHPKMSFGSGLGLYLVKKSADFLGGDVSFHDTGNGSLFTLKVSLKGELHD